MLGCSLKEPEIEERIWLAIQYSPLYAFFVLSSSAKRVLISVLEPVSKPRRVDPPSLFCISSGDQIMYTFFKAFLKTRDIWYLVLDWFYSLVLLTVILIPQGGEKRRVTSWTKIIISAGKTSRIILILNKWINEWIIDNNFNLE